MSTSEWSRPLRRTASKTFSALSERFGGLVRRPLRPVQFVAFWLAALLPLAYVPLFATESLADPVTFAGILAVNVVAVVCGHSYNQP